jgi:hypothetical protein
VSATPPRQVYVAYTEPDSPATGPSAALRRGAQVKMVDGVDVEFDTTQTGIDTLNAAFYPATSNETHTFTVLDPGGFMQRTFAMTSENVTSTPVQAVAKIPTATGDVGYMLFNDHLATAEQALIQAVITLNGGDGITDLVLDIRYNSGGYLVVASELAYMIAGARSVGKTFETLRFNSKHPNVNPVTGQPLTPMPFQTTAVGLSAPSGQPLPTFDLQRVFVLTGSMTCSASESIINSLEGIGVEVIQIGSTTCGKPYGFYPTDNCGTTYFTVQFQGKNAIGFGDYTDGFSPANTRTFRGADFWAVRSGTTSHSSSAIHLNCACSALDYRGLSGAYGRHRHCATTARFRSDCRDRVRRRREEAGMAAEQSHAPVKQSFVAVVGIVFAATLLSGCRGQGAHRPARRTRAAWRSQRGTTAERLRRDVGGRYADPKQCADDRTEGVRDAEHNRIMGRDLGTPVQFRLQTATTVFWYEPTAAKWLSLYHLRRGSAGCASQLGQVKQGIGAKR